MSIENAASMSKLEIFQFRLGLEKPFMPNDIPIDIFHYTSPNGFTSILLGDPDYVTLWASRYDCLNDTSEGTYALNIFKEVCKELLDSEIISEYLFDLFTKVPPAHTHLYTYHDGEKIVLDRAECTRYVCSLSRDMDSLAMWNYYSKGSKYEGFNIGFLSSQIEASLEKNIGPMRANYGLYSIIYNKDEQKHMMRELLVDLSDLYTKDNETSIRYIISNQLVQWSLVFKDEHFQHENEVRIIIDVAKKEKGIPVKYHIASGYLVPHIEIQLDKDAVSHATFGPLQCPDDHKKHQLRVMREMLDSNGYSAEAGYSNVPVRY